MTEAEILADIASHGDRVWAILQYWTSVSFGLLVASHFAAEQVNKYALIALLLIYSFFTFTLYQMLHFDQGMILSALAQFETMVDAGASLSLVAQNIIVTSPMASVTPFDRAIRVLMGAGLYFVSIIYPIYCHWKPKH
jgi:hypothetical protein